MAEFKLPSPDAPAEEWGRLAVSIPGIRWAAQRDAPLDAVTGRINDLDRTMYEGWTPYPGAAPDPDDPVCNLCAAPGQELRPLEDS